MQNRSQDIEEAWQAFEKAVKFDAKQFVLKAAGQERLAALAAGASEKYLAEAVALEARASMAAAA